MNKKVLILLSHPIQYFSPLIREMAEKIEGLTVYYCTNKTIKGYFDEGFGSQVKWDIPLLEGYNYKFLKNYAWKPATNNKLFNLINLGIIKVIIKEKPDVIIIHGWSYLTNWLAIITANIMGTEVWLKCENPQNQEIKKSTAKKKLKRILIGRILFKLITKFLYIGKQNKEFYQNYGIKESKFIYSPYAVDNDRLTSQYNFLLPQRELIRKELGISQDELVILFSGKLIPKKRPLDLLQSFHKINLPNTKLLFLGDGDLRTAIESYITANKLNNVTITGFKNQTELPKYYISADIFVLPSTIGETWGLVTNEAMNFHLPIVISDMVGCSSDLVLDGETGFTYSVEDTNDLAQKLAYLITNKLLIKQMGDNAAQHVRSYSYDKSILEILNSLQNN